MQMLEWTLVQMYVHGAGPEGQKRAYIDGDPEAIRGIELFELMKKLGHHQFRDMIADLVPAHLGGERLGIAAAGISDYNRTHDVIWTQCFMNFCVDLTERGFELKPRWKLKALNVWTRIGREIDAGIFPDLDSAAHSMQRSRGRD
jgi:hypothetical protein